MSEGEDLDLPDLNSDADQAGEAPPPPPADAPPPADENADEPGDESRSATDLEAVFDVPVSISAVLGRAHVEVSDLLKLDTGTVLELDRKVGEAIDIYVNNRLVARGEVLVLNENFCVRVAELMSGEKFTP